jgi:F420-non-reducing hydrogenase small subunit
LNFSSKEDAFDAIYNSVSTDNPDRVRPQTTFTVPEGDLHIPYFYDALRPLDQVIDVDYYIPGCPPESHQVAAVIDVVIAVLQGKAELPPKGTVLGAGGSTVCDDCKRVRNIKAIKKFERIQSITIDPELCLLEQGLLCNGPATRNGCGALCPAANAPCIGCYGPAEGVVDYGARMMSALASVIDSNNPEEIEKILDGIVDPAGSFYRFSLANSLLRTGNATWNGK